MSFTKQGKYRLRGVESFNRTMDEYIRGFGTPKTDYWIGLEKMHQMTKAGMKL